MNAPIDVTNIRIETPRLILRPWLESDLEDLYAYASVPGVGEMAGWPHHSSIADSQRVLRMFLEDKDVLALVSKDTGNVIGSLGIHANDNDHVGSEYLGREIGYVLSKAYWGRGLMPEAVKAVIDWLFHEVRLDFIIVGHFDRNAQSKRVVEKCGFQYIKTTKFETRYDTVENSMEYIMYHPERRVNQC